MSYYHPDMKVAHARLALKSIATVLHGNMVDEDTGENHYNRIVIEGLVHAIALIADGLTDTAEAAGDEIL